MKVERDERAAAIRIVFEDGTWWEIEAVLLQGAKRQARAIMAETVGNEATRREIVAAGDEATQVMLVYSTRAWSFEAPVSVDSIDRLPADLVQQVIDVMHREYRGTPAEIVDEEKKG